MSVDFEGKSYDEIFAELERTIIGAALEKYGSIMEVAKRFRVARSTIFRKLKRLEQLTAAASGGRSAPGKKALTQKPPSSGSSRGKTDVKKA